MSMSNEQKSDKRAMSWRENIECGGGINESPSVEHYLDERTEHNWISARYTVAMSNRSVCVTVSYSRVLCLCFYHRATTIAHTPQYTIHTAPITAIESRSVTKHTRNLSAIIWQIIHGIVTNTFSRWDQQWYEIITDGFRIFRQMHATIYIYIYVHISSVCSMREALRRDLFTAPGILKQKLCGKYWKLIHMFGHFNYILLFVRIQEAVSKNTITSANMN